jgi:hypothetical protein
MHVHEACELARCANADGADAEDLRDLASLGSGGKHSGNEMRDFYRLQQRHWGSDFTAQKIILKLKGQHKFNAEDTLTDVLCPYEVFHFLYHSGDFHSNLIGDDITLFEYWKNASTQEWFQNHPLKNSPDKWHKAIPLIWFTDGAEFSKSSAAEGHSESPC